jgi:hypothetical protein
LHRIVTGDSADDLVLALRAAEQGRKNMIGVQRLFAGLQDEVTGDRFWRYQRSISPGLQEYIEALGLIHYLERGTLVTFDETQATLSNADGTPVRTSTTPHCMYNYHSANANSTSLYPRRTTSWASQTLLENSCDSQYLALVVKAADQEPVKYAHLSEVASQARLWAFPFINRH